MHADPGVCFLSREELEALLRAVPTDGVLGPTEYALYIVAAMTGLREGELRALRWCDIDWTAGVVHVRRTANRVKRETPKPRRASRTVPLADRAARELERHFQRSAYRADEELVFCHPYTGNPYDASKLRERFYATMHAAGMGHRVGRKGGITFHSLRHTFGTRMAACADTDATRVDGTPRLRDDVALHRLRSRPEGRCGVSSRNALTQRATGASTV